MSHTIAVYRGPQGEPFGSLPLRELLDAAMVNILGLGLGVARVQLALLPVPDDDPPGGPPLVRKPSAFTPYKESPLSRTRSLDEGEAGIRGFSLLLERGAQAASVA